MIVKDDFLKAIEEITYKFDHEHRLENEKSF